MLAPEKTRPTAVRARSQVALVVTVVVLAAWNVGRVVAVPGDRHLPFNVAMTVVLFGLGLAGGLDLAGLGLARRHLRSGVRYGGAVLGVILVGLVVAAVVPGSTSPLRDDSVHVTLPAMLVQVLVAIPFGTVLLEELAFRGVLLGLLRQRLTTVAAAVVSALLFGVWHVAGVVNDATGAPALVTAGAVAGTVVATTAAGLGFAWLRLRSHSLVAPMLAHLATNSLTFAAAWAVSR